MSPSIALLADDQILLHPVGSVLAFTDLDSKAQTFIELPTPISAFAVDGRKKFVAVAERSADKPSISVYDASTRRLKKTFTLPVDAGEAKEFVSVAISADGKHVVGQAAAPDWTLYLWQWDKPKPIATFTSSKKVRSRQSSGLNGRDNSAAGSEVDSSSLASGFGNNQGGIRGSVMGSALSVSVGAKTGEAPPVYHVSFHPTDSSKIAVTGLGVLHLLDASETELSPAAAPLTRATALKRTDITAHTWTSDGAWFVVGTADGRVIAYTLTGELVGESQHLVGHPAVARGVKVLVPWTRGVVAAGEFGSVVLYERMDLNANSPMEAAKVEAAGQVPPLPAKTVSAASSRPGSPSLGRSKPNPAAPIFRRLKTIAPGGVDAEHTIGLAITATEDYILASTDTRQIYRLSLMETADESQEKANQPCEAFHRGSISGLDVCIRRPLIATSGTDKTVRIWNYVDKSVEVSRQFMDDPYSLALHPSGLYILVGFPDKLRLMSIVVDDLRMYEEISLRGCRECQFSNGGHLFAAVQGTSIFVYKTWNYELVASFKDHNGKIKSIQWSDDDSTIVSAGFDGSLFVWNWKTGAREFESTIKTTMYGCVLQSPGRNLLYASGYGDKSLREWTGSGSPPREWTLEASVASMCMSPDARTLLLGLTNGVVCNVPVPLQSGPAGELVLSKVKVAHSSITKLKTSPDGRELFATSEDGGLYIYLVGQLGIPMSAPSSGHPTSNQSQADPEISRIFPDEVLTTKSDIEERLQEMRELETRIQEMKSEHEYQIKMKDLQHKENLKVATESLNREIERLTSDNSVLHLEAENRKVQYEKKLADWTDKHAREVQQMEDNYTKKLLAEYDRVDGLSGTLNKSKGLYEAQIQEAKRILDETVAKMTENEKERLAKKQGELDSLQLDLANQKNAFQQQLEDLRKKMNADLAEQKEKYEAQLLSERNHIVSLKADNGILRKKAQGSQTEIEAHKAEVVKKIEEIKRLQGVIKGLEKDIVALNHEVSGKLRDSSLLVPKRC